MPWAVLVVGFHRCVTMRFGTFWPPLWLRRVVLLQSSRSCNPSICEQFQRRSTITDDNARVDIRANGFWGGRFETAFFDVRVFNALAASYRSTSLAACYRNHESMKRNHYEERIRRMEHSSFTPLVFSIFGGAGPLATVALKNLAACLAGKREIPYSRTLNWLRTRLSFSLLQSALMALRGSRSSRCHPMKDITPVLAMAEAGV